MRRLTKVLINTRDPVALAQIEAKIERLVPAFEAAEPEIGPLPERRPNAHN